MTALKQKKNRLEPWEELRAQIVDLTELHELAVDDVAVGGAKRRKSLRISNFLNKLGAES